MRLLLFWHWVLNFCMHLDMDCAYQNPSRPKCHLAAFALQRAQKGALRTRNEVLSCFCRLFQRICTWSLQNWTIFEAFFLLYPMVTIYIYWGPIYIYQSPIGTQLWPILDVFQVPFRARVCKYFLLPNRTLNSKIHLLSGYIYIFGLSFQFNANI